MSGDWQSSIPESLRGTWEAARQAGHDRNELERLVSEASERAGSLAGIRQLKTELGLAADDDSLERLMIGMAAENAPARIPELPLDPFVKQLLEKEIHASLTLPGLSAGTYNFARAAMLSTLRRFPAGPMEWEVSGIPRSWLFQAAPRDWFRMLSFITTRFGGFRPCFFMHVAPRPRSLALVFENEVMRAYHRMARSLELQPGVRGIVACAWFHDPRAVADNPQLEALSRPYMQNGGAIVLLKQADEKSGMLEGSAQRRKLYAQVLLSYRYGLAMWPRADVLSWAAAHPQYAD